MSPKSCQQAHKRKHTYPCTTCYLASNFARQDKSSKCIMTGDNGSNPKMTMIVLKT